MEKLLSAHLSRVCRLSKFYAGLKADCQNLGTFPISSKNLILGDLDGVLSRETGDIRKALLESLEGSSSLNALNSAPEYAFGPNIVIEQTSGTSGVPMRLPKTRAERTALSLAAILERQQFDPGLDMKGFVPLHHLAYNKPLNFSIWSESPEHLCELYAWLGTLSARWIHLPTAQIRRHAEILGGLNDFKRPEALRFIEATGSHVSADLVSLAKTIFGSEIINQYGTRETWAIGYARGTDPFEINSRSVHVELVDENLKPIAGEDIEGEILVTSLVLELLPIVRYRTGDRGSWVRFTDASGCAKRRLRLSAERDLNMLYLNGKFVPGTQLFRSILKQVFIKIGYSGLRQIQVVQAGENELTVNISRSSQSAAICQRFDAECRKMIPGMRVSYLITSNRGSDQKDNLFVNKWRFATESRREARALDSHD